MGALHSLLESLPSCGLVDGLRRVERFELNVLEETGLDLARRGRIEISAFHLYLQGGIETSSYKSAIPYY